MKRLDLILATLCVLVGLISLPIGPMPIGLDTILPAVIGVGPEDKVIIVQSIRLPRILCAFLVGAALAASGAGLQGLLRNPLAEPGVLGVTASSLFGATIALSFGVGAAVFLVPLAAIGGAIGATLLIATIAIRVRSIPTLILFGIGLTSFIGALMSLILSLAPTPFTLAELVNWSFGTVENRSWRDLALAAPFLLAGGIALWISRRGHSLLSLGEDAARIAGLDVQRHRMVTVVGAGLLTGAAVSIAGGIGFVGIVAPHIIRPLIKHDPGATILSASLLGGLLLMVADLALRILPFGSDLRLGVLTALLGAPAFVWIALQRKGGL